MPTLPCPVCTTPTYVRFDTDMRGGVVELWAPHDCGSKPKPAPRKPARYCQQCDEAEVPAKHRFCPACAKARRAERDRKRWREDAEYRERKREQKRRYAQTPAGRERKRMYVKRSILKNPASVIEATRRTNARPERIRARREWAHRNQTRYVGPGIAPACACGASIPWDGRGRPMKACEACDPKRWAQARRRAERTQQPDRRAA